MSLNVKQKVIILISALLIALMEFYPPWIYEFPEISWVHAAGYHFLFNPPPPKSPEEIQDQSNPANRAVNQPSRFKVSLDYRRLIAQDFILLLFTIGLCAILKKPLSLANQTVGGLFLFFGIIGLMLFIDRYITDIGFLKFLD